MKFAAPPTIERRYTSAAGASYGLAVYADASALSPGERLTLESAVGAFGFLVPRGLALTGNQWVYLIEQAYDPREPRTEECLRVIRKAMQCDRWRNDWLLMQTEDGCERPVYRGTWKECESRHRALQRRKGPAASFNKVAECPGEMVEQYERLRICDFLLKNGAFLARSDVDVSQEYAVHRADCFPALSVSGEDLAVVCFRASLMDRALSFLKQHPVRPESFTSEQIADIEAQTFLFDLLCREIGYVAAAAQRNPEVVAQAGNTASDTPATRGESTSTSVGFANYARQLAQATWWLEGDRKVWLVRPTPLIGVGRAASFESFLHADVVGWRVPTSLVAHVQAQPDQHGDQASSCVPERMRA